MRRAILRQFLVNTIVIIWHLLFSRPFLLREDSSIQYPACSRIGKFALLNWKALLWADRIDVGYCRWLQFGPLQNHLSTGDNNLWIWFQCTQRTTPTVLVPEALLLRSALRFTQICLKSPFPPSCLLIRSYSCNWYGYFIQSNQSHTSLNFKLSYHEKFKIT